MWRVERMGWIMMAIILVAAAGGVFGHGALAKRTLQPAPGLLVEYERFARAHSPMILRISFARQPKGGVVSLWLSGDYLSKVEVGRITPEPDRSELTAGGVNYYFTARQGPSAIVFHHKANHAGSLSGSFRLDEEPPVNFQQFVYP
jgi:hypothetical protein